jgi:nicotinamidase-related amidase
VLSPSILIEGVFVEKLGVDALRIKGCVTHICVLFIIADAVLRDYAFTVVEDGVAGLAKEYHDATLRIMKNILGALLVKSGAGTEGRKVA